MAAFAQPCFGRDGAAAFVAERNTAPGGKLPVNTNGGGLSYTRTGMYVQGRTVKVGVQSDRPAALNQMIPLVRGGPPEEAAGAVYLFCSPDSDYVSGQTLVVNGAL